MEVQEIHQVVASHTPPAGDLACNPGMCPDWESNPRPFGFLVDAQSTELHQPGLYPSFKCDFLGILFLICTAATVLFMTVSMGT